jgi:hypothetical protein
VKFDLKLGGLHYGEIFIYHSEDCKAYSATWNLGGNSAFCSRIENHGNPLSTWPVEDLPNANCIKHARPNVRPYRTVKDLVPGKHGRRLSQLFPELAVATPKPSQAGNTARCLISNQPV